MAQNIIITFFHVLSYDSTFLFENICSFLLCSAVLISSSVSFLIVLPLDCSYFFWLSKLQKRCKNINKKSIQHLHTRMRKVEQKGGISLNTNSQTHKHIYFIDFYLNYYYFLFNVIGRHLKNFNSMDTANIMCFVV